MIQQFGAEGEFMPLTLITGGARSGKSLHAERLALQLSAPQRPFYISTAGIWDGEMADRVAKHQARRADHWREDHDELDLIAALSRCQGQGARLVDCLTLWVSNLMHHGKDVETEAQALGRYLQGYPDPVILVTSEVGLGIVPENALARAYRDHLGLVNQTLGAVCDRIDLVVAGHPLRIK